MIYIPTWIANTLLFITCYLSGFQHVQMKYANPVTNLQFFMVAFTLLAILFIATRSDVSPVMSMVYFVVSALCLGLMIRQHRYLPPRQSFE